MFEVDEELSVEEDVSTASKGGISKRGWLYKAPDFGVSSLSVKVGSFAWESKAKVLFLWEYCFQFIDVILKYKNILLKYKYIRYN